MNQPTTPNTENCRLRLCCREDAHSADCTTYDPARYPDDCLADRAQRRPVAGSVDTPNERAAFEKEANDARFFPAELSFALTKSPSGRDEYANSHLQSRWEGWQARARLSPAAPSGEAMAYADPLAFVNFKAGVCDKEWMWAKPDAGLVPLYTHPAPSDDLAEQYSDMLRKICFEYSAGGYNSEGLMSPAVADSKLRWIINDVQEARAWASKPAPSEIEAAIELPLVPAPFMHAMHTRSALISYATEAVLKDRANRKESK